MLDGYGMSEFTLLALVLMTAAELHTVALFVTSPDGHMDDERLQAGFAWLQAQAPVIRVEPARGSAVLVGHAARRHRGGRAAGRTFRRRAADFPVE